MSYFSFFKSKGERNMAIPKHTLSIERPAGLKLGDKARDKISGFSGIVVAITEWLNGCLRITIQPQELKDGKPIDNHTFDAEQVEVVEPVNVAPSKPHGGPSIAPVRSADPK